MNYDLAEISDPPRGKSEVLLPTIEESLRARRAYLATLRRMLVALVGAVGSEVLPQVEEEKRRMADSAEFLDALSASLWERIRALAVSLAATASRTVDSILSLESQRHTDQFVEAARKTLGIDLRAVVRQEDLTDLLAAVSIRNAELIKDLSQETVAKIARTVSDSVLSGQGARELRGEIKEVMETSDSRAELIATDQTAKLNSDLNRARQEQAGVDKYVWRTSQDERVRPRHRRLDGHVYEWGEPTGAESGLPPGKPIRCRCVAQGVVEF